MRKVNILGRKVSVLAILMAVLVIGTASAAIFMNYATLTGQVTVSNDISVTDYEGNPIIIGGDGDLNFNSPATFTINNVGTEPVIVDLLTTLYLDTNTEDEIDGIIVTDYAGLTVDYSVIEGVGVEGANNGEGLGAIPVLVPPGGLTVDVTFEATDNTIPGEYTIQVDVNTNSMDYQTFTGDNAGETLVLSYKTTTWALDTNFGTVVIDYIPMGNDFVYRLTSNGVTLEDYALIYYADKPDRFVEWGGDNPGLVINDNINIVDGDTFDVCVDLGMNLPHMNDANYDTTETNYSEAPDFYENSCGAKLQLIPISDLTSFEDTVVLPMTTWNHVGRYLLETDLIHYTNTDL